MKQISAALFLLFAASVVRAAEPQALVGVPSTVQLTVGFGENFDEDNFIVIGGFGAVGIVEVFNTDIWLTSGLYTDLIFAGDLIDESDVVARMGINPPTVVDLPTEGWAISPGIVLGLMLGFIPAMDIYLLGYYGPNFALVSKYQRQSGVRVKIDELEGRVGHDYGGAISFAYTGSNPLLNGLTLGAKAGYHENTFDRWHFGFTLGFSF